VLVHPALLQDLPPGFAYRGRFIRVCVRPALRVPAGNLQVEYEAPDTAPRISLYGAGGARGQEHPLRGYREHILVPVEDRELSGEASEEGVAEAVIREGNGVAPYLFAGAPGDLASQEPGEYLSPAAYAEARFTRVDDLLQVDPFFPQEAVVLDVIGGDGCGPDDEGVVAVRGGVLLPGLHLVGLNEGDLGFLAEVSLVCAQCLGRVVLNYEDTVGHGGMLVFDVDKRLGSPSLAYSIEDTQLNSF
jgi:hypothetical protein